MKDFSPQTPNCFAHLVVLIRQERKVKQLFFRKTGEFFGFIGADTQHINARFFQLIHVIA